MINSYYSLFYVTPFEGDTVMDNEIADFVHYLTIEKGLAENTVKSYERDLKQYQFSWKTNTPSIKSSRLSDHTLNIFCCL